MAAYIFRRLLATIPVLVVVAIFVFLLLHLTPGDPASVIAGDYASPEDIEKIRTKLGLNQPLHIQFLDDRTSWSLGIYFLNYLYSRPQRIEQPLR